MEKFETYLETYWMENHYEGQSKDQSIDACEAWIEQLDVAEVIELAQKWGDIIRVMASAPSLT